MDKLVEFYSEKKRLAASTSIVWEAFLELIHANNIPDADIPMKYFMKAIICCLKTYGAYGKGIYFPDKKAWVEAVKNSGYLKSLQCIGM